MTSNRRLLIAENVRTARGIPGNAILIEDGRVIAVGDHRTLDRPGITVENYAGAILIPGLRDAHMHPVTYAASLSGTSLRSTTSIGELQNTIRMAVANLAFGRPLVALRLDDENLAEQRLPTRLDLDEAVPDRPVLIHRYCGHVAIANTAALRHSGVDASTPDPADGSIDRDAGGEPTGILRETAIDLVSTRLDASESVTAQSLLDALTGLAGLGITSIGAMLGLGDGPWASLGDEVSAIVAVADRLPVNVHGFVIAHSVDDLEAAALRLNAAGGRLRWAGYKGFADGSLGGHTAAMHAPFTDRPDELGTMRLDASDRLLAEAALRMGGMVALHAIGDRANGAVVDLYEELIAAGAPPHRLRIEHASVLDRADIDRIARLGVVVSVQPAFLGSEFEWIADRVGPDRIVTTYPFASLDHAGVPMCAGSDSPVESPDPWVGLALARDRAGVTESESLLPDRALSLFTDGGAASLGEPLPLSPGSPADIVAVDRDPVASDPDQVRNTVVHETWVHGERIVVDRTRPISGR
ncbi:MAG: amidohydrolase [Actinomycetota bacterium]|nr:amidohydrolase [Actinomycetota bacterium]